MKRLWLILFLLLAIISGQQRNIAVLQFDAENVSDSEARILTNRLNTELFNTGKFIVIERSQIDEVIKEQGFQQSGCVTSECAVEVGKLLGVDAMVSGSIGRIGSFYTISAKMTDIQSAKIINTVSKDVSGSIDILLTKTMAEIASDLTGSENEKAPDNQSKDDSRLINARTGEVEFFSNPTGVEIEISRVDKGKILWSESIGNSTYQDLWVGFYRFTAKKENYKLYEGEFEIKHFRKIDVFINLEKARTDWWPTRTLDITSNVDSAEVIINDKFIGKTPLKYVVPSTSSDIVFFKIEVKDWPNYESDFHYENFYKSKDIKINAFLERRAPAGEKVINYSYRPEALSPIKPKYPEIAQEAGIEGFVLLWVFVDEKGRVKKTSILKGIPNTGLNEAAIKAVRAVRFKPAGDGFGGDIGVWIKIPVYFSLKK